ncbi:MAG: DUF4468 domain-containing protein [Bacteroidaceae bacterium]
MKKVLLALFALLSMAAGAKSNVDSKYLAGGVPEENGMVIFRKSFRVPDKDQQEILTRIRSFVSDDLVGKGIEGLRTRMLSDGQDDALVVARVEEYLVFKSKPLYLDRTRFRYQVSARVTDDRVDMEISQISYYYGEQADGTKGETYKAEEWITDKEALAKGGQKLYPRSGKFRIKTIDRTEEIFAQAIDKFEERRTVEVRSGVVVTE